jgi:hypothetical protein
VISFIFFFGAAEACRFARELYELLAGGNLSNCFQINYGLMPIRIEYANARRNAAIHEKGSREPSAVHLLQLGSDSNVARQQPSWHGFGGSIGFAHSDLLAPLWHLGSPAI